LATTFHFGYHFSPKKFPFAKKMQQHEKNFCTVVFDRKRTMERRGIGKVEIHIKLPLGARKYITVKECDIQEWMEYSKSKELAALVASYEGIVSSMVTLGEELTRENLEAHLYNKKGGKPEKDPLQESFLDFMRNCIEKEDIDRETRRQRLVSLHDVEAFGKLQTFADLTPANIREYDFHVRAKKKADGKPFASATIDNYHKRLHHYIRMAYEREIINRDPYDSVKIARGRNKERKPLLEEELVKLRDAELDAGYLDRVRDLFVFSAYTGLAYVDVMSFDFFTMAEQNGDMFYIDGKRTKTGTDFYTPILPPAMKILKKYKFQLPKISNQKLNMYLHVVEAKVGIRKKICFHLARHSFATMVLAHDVPIDKLARMLGHKNVKTTQVYAKILKSTINTHSSRLAAELL